MAQTHSFKQENTLLNSIPVSLFDNITFPLILTSFESGRVLYVNRCLCETFEISESELLQKNILALDNWERSDKTQYIDRLSEQDQIRGYNLDIKKSNGETLRSRLYSSIIEYFGEKILLTMAPEISITQESPETIQPINDKLPSFYEESPTAVALINPDTMVITDANKVFCTESGYSKEEIKGKSWGKHFPSIVMEKLIKQYKDNPDKMESAANEYEFEYINKMGEIKHSFCHISYLVDCNMLVTAFKDITRYKNRNTQFEQQNTELKKKVDEKNKELTINLLKMTHSTETLSKLNQKVKQLKQSISSKEVALVNDIDLLLQDLERQNENMVWKRMNEHLETLRPTFSSILTNRHPNLTPAEIKLCELLSLNIQTKEIASIMNQTYDSIRVSRTRLRKKLELSSKDNLVTYLLSLCGLTV